MVVNSRFIAIYGIIIGSLSAYFLRARYTKQQMQLTLLAALLCSKPDGYSEYIYIMILIQVTPTRNPLKRLQSNLHNNILVS